MRKKSGGYAMVLAICVMALLVALSLSLLLTASVVIAESQQESKMERCRILAVSLSQQFEGQLLDAKHKDFQSLAEETAANDDSLWFYVKNGITSGAWPYYNEDEPRHTPRYAYRTFTFTDLPAELSGVEAEVLLYWESDRESAYDGSPLHIEVTCTMDGQTCTVASVFELSVADAVAGSDPVYEPWKWSPVKGEGEVSDAGE